MLPLGSKVITGREQMKSHPVWERGLFSQINLLCHPCLVIELGLLVIGNVPMDLEIFPIRALLIKADKDRSYLLFQPILEQLVNIYRLK